MTCVLSIPVLYTNLYSEGSGDLQNNGCEKFDFTWINAKQPLSGLSDNQRCSKPCHMEPSTSSASTCRMEMSSGFSGSVKHEQFHVPSEEGIERDLETNNSDKDLPRNGKDGATNLYDSYSRTYLESSHMTVKNHGFKRKTDITECEEVYIPSKRVSPFLNTPKERKDERKKILKISLKKLRQLEDPESFLRRTVLVNNTRKRLQTELRQEKLRSKKFASNKRKSCSEYGVLSNNCLSDSYLFDDPFLSGVHEKITDDMTDTLIKNVFLDKPNEKGKELDICEKSDINFNEMESDDSSNQSPSDKTIGVLQASKECSILTGLNHQIDSQEMSVGGCAKEESTDMCYTKECRTSENICLDSSVTMVVGESDNKYVQNTVISSDDVKVVQCNQNIKYNELQSIAIQMECINTVQNFFTTEINISNKTSKGVINEHSCGIGFLEP